MAVQTCMTIQQCKQSNELANQLAPVRNSSETAILQHVANRISSELYERILFIYHVY